MSLGRGPARALRAWEACRAWALVAILTLAAGLAVCESAGAKEPSPGWGLEFGAVHDEWHLDAALEEVQGRWRLVPLRLPVTVRRPPLGDDGGRVGVLTAGVLGGAGVLVLAAAGVYEATGHNEIAGSVVIPIILVGFSEAIANGQVTYDLIEVGARGEWKLGVFGENHTEVFAPAWESRWLRSEPAAGLTIEAPLTLPASRNRPFLTLQGGLGGRADLHRHRHPVAAHPNAFVEARLLLRP